MATIFLKFANILILYRIYFRCSTKMHCVWSSCSIPHSDIVQNRNPSIDNSLISHLVSFLIFLDASTNRLLSNSHWRLFKNILLKNSWMLRRAVNKHISCNNSAITILSIYNMICMSPITRIYWTCSFVFLA